MAPPDFTMSPSLVSKLKGTLAGVTGTVHPSRQDPDFQAGHLVGVQLRQRDAGERRPRMLRRTMRRAS